MAVSSIHLQLRLEINDFTGLVAHTFSFSINTRFYTITYLGLSILKPRLYTAPLPLPPLVAASASLLLLLIPLSDDFALTAAAAPCCWTGSGRFRAQSSNFPLDSCCRQGPLLNYYKIRQFRCKVFTRLNHFRIDFARIFWGVACRAPSPNPSPALV